MTEEAPAIGINFGTSNTSVAVFHQGQVVTVPNEFGNKLTPSCIAFINAAPGYLVGEAAREFLATFPASTVYAAKRLLGRHYDDPVLQKYIKQWPFEIINHEGKPKIRVDFKGEKKAFFPEEICAFILLKMKEIAEAYLGKTVTNVVISVPANYEDSQRRALKDAGTIAGLNVLRIINDPTAAAIAYGFQEMDEEKRDVLIFDLGGGTLDVSVVTVEGATFKVKSTAGDSHLGGEDFMRRLVSLFINEFKKKNAGKDLFSDKIALSRLHIACEEAKRLLSSSQEVPISIESLMDGISFNSSISRKRYEELNNRLFCLSLELVKKAIWDADRMDPSEIQDVILLGGSTRIPKIHRLLSALLGQEKLSNTPFMNPDEAVAHGAAFLAANINGDQSELFENFSLSDIVPHSMGVGVDEGIMSTIIRKSSAIPVSQSAAFSTCYDNQKCTDFTICEGDDVMEKDNKKLGEIWVKDIPPAVRGSATILITYAIDLDGILKIAVEERSLLTESSISITYDDARLAQEDVTQLALEMKRFRLEEIRQRDLEKAKSDLKNYCHDLKWKLERIAKRKNAVVKKCNEVIKSLESPDQLMDNKEVEQAMGEMQRLFDEIFNANRDESGADVNGVRQNNSDVLPNSNNKRRRTDGY